MSLLLRAAVAWLGLLVAMFGNGTLRVLVLQPRMGDEAGRRLASLLGVVIVAALSGVFVAGAGPASPRQLVGVGALWVALTLAFEFLFGHYVSGQTWEALLADYDLARGRLWPLVLLATAVSPWIWGAVRARPGP